MNATDRQTPNTIISRDGANWGKSNQWYWNGLRCHWRVLGENNHKSIVFLHGFGASSGHWRKNAGDFVNAGFRVYALDLIGFGDSEQPPPNKARVLDNGFWAKQLEAFLEQIVDIEQNGKTVLIGNSLGSLVALTASVFRPDLISAVVASPLPDPAFMEPKFLESSVCLRKLQSLLINIFCTLLPLEILLPLISRRVFLKIALQSAYHQPINYDEELLQLISRPARQRTAPRALRAMCIGMATRQNSIKAPFLLNQVENLDNAAPILLIWGKEDKLVPLRIGKQIEKMHTAINLFVLEASGHCPHDESSKQFNEIALNWLKHTLANDQKKL